MKRGSIKNTAAVLLGILACTLFCFFIDGLQFDSDFQITHAHPTPYTSADGEMKKNGKININTADAKTLDELPNIGEKMAERIIKYRSENGGFKQIQDIMKVKGIGEKTFEEIKDRIYVDFEGDMQ